MNKRFIGFSLLLLSTMIYGFYGILSRYIGAFGPFSQAWVRYCIIITTIIILLLSKKFSWKKIDPKDFKWFLLWILPASFQPVLTFIAFNHLPIGITNFLLYSTMILGGIISGKVFFKEIFGPEKVIALILTIGGLYLIYQTDITLINNPYVFLAILSGFILGLWNTLSKKVSQNYHELQMILLDSLSTLAVGLSGAMIIGETLPTFQNSAPWYWILIFSFSGIITSLLLIRGFKYLEAQTGSLILPMELFFASLFGYLFFGERLGLNIYIGGLLIAISSIVPNIYTIYKSKQ